MDRKNLRALEAFEAVSRHLSISRAADELGISQSAVSHQLRQLNQRIGERLFVRAGRGIALSEAGQKLGERLQGAFLQMDQSLAEVVGINRRVLRLAICPSFGPGWLIGRLAGFYEANPDIDLQLCMHARDPELTDRVADAFVTAYPTVAGFWSLLLCPEILVPVIAKRSRPMARQALITTEFAPKRLGADWLRYAGISGLELSEVHNGRWIQVSHHVTALTMVTLGMGAALVPDFLAAEGLQAEKLETLGGQGMPTGEDYYLCIRESRRDEPALRELAAWFRAQLMPRSRPAPES